MRAEPFGSKFVSAQVWDKGEFTSWSCVCFLHTKDANKCTKTLKFGKWRHYNFTPDQAKHRIMQWCLNGVGIPNAVGAKLEHHNTPDPRQLSEDELRSVEQLTREAQSLR